jgi:arsenate reductase
MGRRLHWDLEDPASVEGTEEERLEAFRRSRDEIETMVRDFIATVRAGGYSSQS